VYSCKFLKPSMNAVLACGANTHAAKIFSTDTGLMLHDFSSVDPLISKSPLVCVDTSPIGKLAVVGAANGQLHVKNITIVEPHPEEAAPALPQLALPESTH
jgi:hypothetical protein